MWVWLGGLGLGLALLQLVASLVGGLQRHWLERRSQRLHIERIREEIGHLRRSQVSSPAFNESWAGYRKFRVLRKRTECENCQSIYLVPHDGRPLPAFRPGQYLTLSVPVPGARMPLVRCYSLSDSPHEDHYRITIKKVTAWPSGADDNSTNDATRVGKASSYLCDGLKAGDILDIRAPQGKFFLDLASPRPVVFLGAGIGVTPLIAMLNTLLDIDPNRETYFFLGMRSSREHPFKEHLRTLATRHSRLRIVTCYSMPRETDHQGEDYQRLGRLDARIVSAILPSSNFEFFVCGPSEFMGDMLAGLKQWGARDEFIHAESFGPISFRQLAKPAVDEVMRGVDPSSGRPMVRFDRSNRELSWNPASSCLLDVAEGLGIAMNSGCRTGSCGSCATAIKAGQVRYTSPTDYACEDGVCLPCVCIPEGPLVLDA